MKRLTQIITSTTGSAIYSLLNAILFVWLFVDIFTAPEKFPLLVAQGINTAISIQLFIDSL